jgi:hypothetical protein
MRRYSALAVALGLATAGAQAAIVQYSLTGATEHGTVVSGSFSYDSDVIGQDYFSISAGDDLLSFSVSMSSIAVNGPFPGSPTSTSFDLSDAASSFFVIITDETGTVVEFAPGTSTNADGYSLDPSGNEFSSNLIRTTVGLTDTVTTWQLTQVPELSHTALGAGLGLLGFVGFRAWRNRR